MARRGRKTKFEEWKVDDVCKQSIAVIARYINDEEQPLDKRAELASKFVLKRMPAISDVNHKVELLTLSNSTAEKVAKLLEDNSAQQVEYEVIGDEMPSVDNKSDPGPTQSNTSTNTNTDTRISQTEPDESGG